MSFSQVGSIAPCVRAACQDICKMEVDLKLWPLSMCTAAPEMTPPPKPPASSGCDVVGGRDASTGAAFALAVAMALRRRRNRQAATRR
jgi:hypothetical protein